MLGEEESTISDFSMNVSVRDFIFLTNQQRICINVGLVSAEFNTVEVLVEGIFLSGGGWVAQFIQLQGLVLLVLFCVGSC